jgi:hypothetical protein
MPRSTSHFPRGPHSATQNLLDGSTARPAHSHPQDVLNDHTLSTADKRSLLASWASDVYAVEGRPAWRQLPGSGVLVSVDDVLGALKALDRADLH